MSFLNEYNFDLLKNEAEVLVIREVENQVKNHPGMCLCNECIVDISAIALNNVKPLYRFSILGTLYTSQAMTEQSYAESVKKAVAEAIERVKKNPAHD